MCSHTVKGYCLYWLLLWSIVFGQFLLLKLKHGMAEFVVRVLLELENLMVFLISA